jgi:flagellar FliL protein
MAAPSDSVGGSGAPKAKGFSLVGLLIELVVVAVVAGGAGAAMAFLQGAPPPTAAPPASDKPSAAPERSLVDLPPIVTNIASPNDLWIRVEASIVIEGKNVMPPDILAAEIATDALAYLRTLTIGQIEGPIGLENIRQDLADRASVRSKGKVSELILKTLVLQ